MRPNPNTPVEDLEEQEAHRRGLVVLQDGGFSPMVGGAYALRTYTGIWRDTKDLDLFLRKDRIHEALATLAKAGYRVELTDEMWLAKAFMGDYFIDLIFSSGNGIGVVDEHWERRAARADVLGRDSLIVPAEEMIWQKAFIQERERFDGADIHHLIRCRGDKLDWRHLMTRFERYWQVLLVHLITFRFSFPSEKHMVPTWLMQELTRRLEQLEQQAPVKDKVCRGTLLSRNQYYPELQSGYRDAREMESHGWTGTQPFTVTPPVLAGTVPGAGEDEDGNAHRSRG